MTVDTVKNAETTPDAAQPHAELGLRDDEYARIREILGRRPTSSELAMYSVMWSEHCSYKSSKVHLRQFGDKQAPSAADVLLVGIGSASEMKRSRPIPNTIAMRNSVGRVGNNLPFSIFDSIADDNPV